MFEMPGHREGFVKKVVCHACGAQKRTASVTAFVYCDYCAALTDWDFQVAISDPESRLPGPAYEALCAALAEPVAAALAQRDRPAYRKLQQQIFACYVEACPAACPPRCAEEGFRTQYIDYMADCATVGAFEPVSAERTERLNQAVGKLEWTQEGGATKVEATSFWRMFDAFEATMEPTIDGVKHPAYALVHPDGAPVPLLQKMATSMFVQGWIPYLATAMTEKLLGRTGLASEYVQAPEVSTTHAACGHCGKGLDLAEGAKRTLCEGCGHIVIAGRGAVPCSSCGAALAMPEGTNAFACPFCKVEMRVMRW